MSIYRRGRRLWFKYLWHGKLYCQSTKQNNRNVARNMEAADRARRIREWDEKQAKAEQFGCPVEHLDQCPECDKWFDVNHSAQSAEGKSLCSYECLKVWKEKARKVPTLAEFVENRFKPWAKGKFENLPTKTWKGWYEPGLNAIAGYPDLSRRLLREITSEHIAGYAAHLRSRKMQASSVNSRLRVLRRVFHLAVEWGELQCAPKVALLSGENHRERVITPEEEQRYLAASTSLLADVVTVLVDTGMRPEECFRQRWENVTWLNGRFGTILVTHGKTKAARRVLPMTPRVRAILERRWLAAEKPEEGWIWPAPTKSGHVEPSTLKKQHKAALKDSKVRPFVLYSLRHTFLTRLGEKGCDVWTLARIAGHSSIAMSSRYVHPSADKVLDAMALLGGYKIGYSDENQLKN